jgi:hypothetical protein
MKLTANSNPIIPKKTENGIKVTTNINKLEVNNLNKKEDKIANKQWPATIEKYNYALYFNKFITIKVLTY